MKTFCTISILLLVTNLLFSQDQLVPYLKSGKYGYMSSETKKLVIPVQFDHAELFYDEVAYVEKGGEFGFIDKQGNEVVKIGTYVTTDEEPPRFNHGLLAVVKDKKFGVINNKGQVIVPFKYDYIGEFCEGKAAVGMLKEPTDYNFRVENYKTLNIGIDSKNKVFQSRESKNNNQKQRWGENGDLWYGFINTFGKEVVPVQYGKVGDYSEGLALVVKNVVHGKGGYIDHSGIMTIPAQFVEAYDFKYGFSHVRRTHMYGDNYIASNYEHVYVMDSPNGIINKYGKLILATIPVQHFLGQNKNGFILKSWDEKVCFSDYKGDLKIPFDDYVEGIVCEGAPLAFKTSKGTYQFHDSESYQKLNATLSIDKVKEGKEGMIIFSTLNSSSFGVLNKDLNVIVQPKYDFISTFNNGFAKVLKSKNKRRVTTKHFFIDSTGFEYVDLNTQ
ncbi:WG repeat-containing protein [Flammeovirga aprica]|uniref:WG repeat-containing protein n=1 Tax=Flammeovirga aprica JL-4 TaxID=694437 RepID=A0A7X9RUV1_9BACT|nr:WG repeat-containing protein [Flammeovirga aprica]NME69127.1 WG repeat-containing protein [Flammeovirga aprica JL-4]